jgi:hypothetical protein
MNTNLDRITRRREWPRQILGAVAWAILILAALVVAGALRGV